MHTWNKTKTKKSKYANLQNKYIKVIQKTHKQHTHSTYITVDVTISMFNEPKKEAMSPRLSFQEAEYVNGS